MRLIPPFLEKAKFLLTKGKVIELLMGKEEQKEVNWKNLLKEEAQLKGYSPKTIQSYLFQVERFLESRKKPRQYLLDLIEKNKSNETIRSAGFAIKFYLKCTKQSDGNLHNILQELPNRKREKRLPVVLAKEEIEKMIIATPNIIHRAIIQVGYAAGLRVSEIRNLKWNDIDEKRKVIHIKQAKGKKDRIVMLSPKVKKTLNKLPFDKTSFVFKTNRGAKYTTRTIQVIIQNAAKKAGIRKKVTPHTLRHSFATHLLEKGTDIRYIKELLGHADVSTTLIYTRVSNKDISQIKSPLD